MTDEQPTVQPDENNEPASPPSHGVASGPDGIPKGVDTEPQSSPDDPAIPGQPETPDVVGGL